MADTKRKIALPQRATRGNRMAVLMDQQDEADVEFWNQDFFADGVGDDAYKTEEEEEDVVDSDFYKSEGDDDTDDAEQPDEKKVKKKALQPPGIKKKAVTRPPTKQSSSPKQPPRRVAPPVRKDYQAPTLRHSTRTRVLEAEKERQRLDKAKPKRVKRRTGSEDQRLLSQAELLAEAAKTEIENLKSLQVLVALEEATKREAAQTKEKYNGPILRYHSKRTEDNCLTVFQLVNTSVPPPELRMQKALPYPKPQTCVVTGLPAKYRDPVSGLPYANLAAYQELKRKLAANPHKKIKHHRPV